MRTFIAIKINPDALLQEVISSLRMILGGEAINWVDPINFHLTLKFLGETSETQLTHVKKILKGVALSHPPFEIRPMGLGYFKSNGMPRVLFMKVHDEGQMAEIAGEIQDLLVPVGFEEDTRKFNAHLTLARIRFLKDKKRFYDAVDKFSNLSLPQYAIKELTFFQSILKPSGPHYHELAALSLGGISDLAVHTY